MYKDSYYELEFNILTVIVWAVLGCFARWKIINRKKRKSTKIQRIIFAIAYFIIIFMVVTKALPILLTELTEAQRWSAIDTVQLVEIVVYPLMIAELVINTGVRIFADSDVFLDNDSFI